MRMAGNIAGGCMSTELRNFAIRKNLGLADDSELATTLKVISQISVELAMRIVDDVLRDKQAAEIDPS